MVNANANAKSFTESPPWLRLSWLLVVPLFGPPLFTCTGLLSSSTTHARRMAPSIRRRALHLPCSGSPALLARRARRAPRPLAHFCTCPHARTERCCPVLHCTACSLFRFVICAAYLRSPGPRAIPYLDLCRLADADQLESVRGATRVVCAKGLVFLSRTFYLVRSLFLSRSSLYH